MDQQARAIDWAAVRAALGDIPVADDPATLRLKSRDFFWFSPILKEALDDCRADLIVSPRDKAELIRVASIAARFRVPITVRGGGTGNYGQAVPLDGGIVLDTTALDRVLAVRTGAGRFEAGARMLEIDRALKPAGQELRFHPSTRKQATIGGFVCGGAAGAGSCTWGQITDPGAVIAVEVVTVEETPRILELWGADTLKVMHAYGVNGIVTEVELPLAPRHDWAERIAAFPDFMTAARFGQDFTEKDGIAKKLVSIHDPRIPAAIKRLRALVPAGQAMAILMVSEPQADALEELVARHGGTIVYRRQADEAERAAFDGEGAMPPLYEYSWNHTTLHVLKTDPTVTYLQLRFPAGRNLELAERVEREFPDEIWLHLEFQRRFGRATHSSLPILRYTTPERLDAIIRALDAMEVQVSNPHTYLLDNAGWKRVDADQPRFKSETDPHGLMNPGKLKAWPPTA
jgi:FAD/FMN-containing dehydrogenase